MKNKQMNYLLCFLCLIFFFKPICFQYYSNLVFLEDLFVYGKILIACFILLYFLKLLLLKKQIKLSKINPFVLKVLVFELSIFLITFVKNGLLSRSFINLVSTVLIVVLILVLYKKDKKVFIKSFSNLALLLVFLQLLSEIIFPGGMNADLYLNNLKNPLYFMTLDNGTSSLVILTMLLLFLDNILNNKDSNNRYIGFIFIIKNLICILTAILSGSTTAILCLIILIILFMLARIKNFKILEKGYLMVIIYFIITFMMIEFNFIANIFEFFTGKTGFTGRYFLWEKSIILIKESPLFGYGVLEKDYLEVWGGYFSSHNFILEMLLQGGIIALALWINIVFDCLNKLKNIKDVYIKRILLTSMIILMIALMMENTTHSIYLFSIFTLINCYSLEEKNEEG